MLCTAINQSAPALIRSGQDLVGMGRQRVGRESGCDAVETGDQYVLAYPFLRPLVPQHIQCYR